MLSEEGMELFQVFPENGMIARKEVFDKITEFFDPYPGTVKRNVFFEKQRALMFAVGLPVKPPGGTFQVRFFKVQLLKLIV